MSIICIAKGTATMGAYNHRPRRRGHQPGTGTVGSITQITQSVNGAENSVTGCVYFRNWAWRGLPEAPEGGGKHE